MKEVAVRRVLPEADVMVRAHPNCERSQHLLLAHVGRAENFPDPAVSLAQKIEQAGRLMDRDRLGIRRSVRQQPEPELDHALRHLIVQDAADLDVLP